MPLHTTREAHESGAGEWPGPNSKRYRDRPCRLVEQHVSPPGVHGGAVATREDARVADARPARLIDL